MRFAMAEDSLFAKLLRSPWWISLAIAIGLVGLARLVLPAAYAWYGASGALPFLVTGAMSAWRRRHEPSAARVDETLRAVRAMSWNEFSLAIEDAFRRDGYVVNRLVHAAADFEMTKGARRALVSCKRWKVARTGIEPLRDLHAAKEAREAHECIHVAAGELSANARSFAAEKRIRIVDGADLARLLPR